ncbi:endonuclease domain of the non-LTR retrotransposon LINE-1 [Elysia marginata]|uniref:Endonuclease domain of the non-LTR retrotransposon LINE-1 n=1 Tax=Elysia marginata TaxID=1093978 RepID=A0AAV4FNC4_9GAST|nr:endonuclease domain of the non-LTR retrotransposon LINE-1 [Elysia marginata]
MYWSPQANAKQAEEDITSVVNKQQTKSPDSVVLITGDFNQCTLSSSLPTFHQYITCPTRNNKTIKLCYGNIEEGYKSTALPPLGISDHCMVQLTPKYRPILKTNKPRKFKVTTKTVENIEALRGCFACTEWTVFQEACENLAELNDIITSYIKFCEGAASSYSQHNKFEISGGSAALFHLGTFNRGQLHVIPTVFKHLGIVRPTTNTHPIFIGPTLINGNSDRKTYSTFFNFIKQELEDAPKDPVIGSDEEMAICIAAKSVFPTGSLISCSRHLKSNMILYLRDKVGLATRTRNNIVSAVFGPGGLTSSPTKAIFEERLTNIKTTINDQAPAYLQHFTSRVLPILQQNLDTMLTWTEASHDWTNNNCESMNHILKMKIDWRPQAIPQLIESTHEIVKGHYTDVERAIMGRGEYRLHEDFKEYFVQPGYGAPRLMNNDVATWRNLKGH